jgi:hypothetical protein
MTRVFIIKDFKNKSINSKMGMMFSSTKKETPPQSPPKNIEEMNNWTPNVLSLMDETSSRGWGALYFGKYPEDPQMVSKLLDIDIFVNLTEDFERDKLNIVPPSVKDTFVTYYFPIVERSIPDNVKNFIDILELTAGKIKKGENVFVHCFNGRGRTGIFMVLLVALLTQWDLRDCYLLVYHAHRLGHGKKKHWENVMLPPRRLQKDFVRSIYDGYF